YNANRASAWDITPYAETIVLDSDYVVNSNQLNLLFEQPHDFLCHRHAYDIADKNSLVGFDTFSKTRLPHFWATVLFFRTTDRAKEIFDLIEMIRDNYDHYAELYGFQRTPFRNDYAVTIAQSINYGHVLDAIPSI
ncbi:MAG: hypothetical protein CUN55_19595, partial [Phototrophicales bacterium]